MKKLFACIVALLMLVPLLAACEPENATTSDTSETVSNAGTTTSGTVSEDTSLPEVEVKDMQGREFNVLCWDWGAGSASILGYTGEIMYDEENPSAVDEAKKQVVDKIEQDYNCTINGEKTNAISFTQTIKNQVSSGLHYYDIVFDSMSTSAAMVPDRILVDLNTVPNLNLSDPWWDQNAVKDLSIAGKVYFACGDINTYDDQGTWCMLFNKTLKAKLGIEEDFYQLVRDKKWTFDKFKEICKNKITSDTSGDGILDENDLWAFGTEKYNIYVHVLASGQKISKKNDNDIPYLTVAEEPEATYTILADILEFYNDENTVMVANTPKYEGKGFKNVWEATVHKAFIEGRELFYMCGLINSASFRVMEDEFGILPIPMYYDTQDRYYHTVSVGNASAMSIPVNTTDIADVGLIVSAIAKESKILVTPAYYDVQLKYRDSRDDESGEMLDLIFSTRTFDIANTYNWGGIREKYTDINQTNIASRFETGLSAANIAMESFIEDILEGK
jgi:ABC-type glycerol-3-phosphate transport system substrate-binding protein